MNSIESDIKPDINANFTIDISDKSPYFSQNLDCKDNGIVIQAQVCHRRTPSSADKLARRCIRALALLQVHLK